jgi:hypothetical protein
MLISIEIQANSQFVLEIAIIVLVIKSDVNNIEEGINAIRVWRS